MFVMASCFLSLSSLMRLLGGPMLFVEMIGPVLVDGDEPIEVLLVVALVVDDQFLFRIDNAWLFGCRGSRSRS